MLSSKMERVNTLQFFWPVYLLENLGLRIKERENISIVVSNDALNQIVSRIHGKFASEVLGYDVIYEAVDVKQVAENITEDERIAETLFQLVRFSVVFIIVWSRRIICMATSTFLLCLHQPINGKP